MARTRLRRRQFSCGMLVLLVSCLHIGAVFQTVRLWRYGQRDGMPRHHQQASAIIEVRLEAPLVDNGQAREQPQAKEMTTPGQRDDVRAWAADPMHPGTLMATPYLPAAELNERPLLLQDIDPLLDLGPDGADIAELSNGPQATAVLLINEHGDVDQLLFETRTLPTYLETILAQRFLAARFRAGKINGKPVRSALRIALQLH